MTHLGVGVGHHPTLGYPLADLRVAVIVTDHILVHLRPVYHRLEDRIRAHVILCWLALLLIRLAENATGDTWRNLRHELDRLHAGEFTGSTGRVLQRSDLTADQQAILAALGVREPPRFLDFTPI